MIGPRVCIVLCSIVLCYPSCYAPSAGDAIFVGRDEVCSAAVVLFSVMINRGLAETAGKYFP